MRGFLGLRKAYIRLQDQSLLYWSFQCETVSQLHFPMPVWAIRGSSRLGYRTFFSTKWHIDDLLEGNWNLELLFPTGIK